MARINDRVAAIATMAADDVRDAWRQRFGETAPALSLSLLRRALAHTEQEDALGGLPAHARKMLDAMASAAAPLNEEGTLLPKSSGENQLLGLAFTAALVEFARLRQNAADHRLLRGTVAPLVLDSPFGQLDDSYRRTTAEHIPRMARQVVLMVSGSQAKGGAVDALVDRVEKEYVLIRTNKGAGKGPGEVRQFRGRDYQTALFDQPADGTMIVEIA